MEKIEKMYMARFSVYISPVEIPLRALKNCNSNLGQSLSVYGSSLRASIKG
jgi:hypothetical protein